MFDVTLIATKNCTSGINLESPSLKKVWDPPKNGPNTPMPSLI